MYKIYQKKLFLSVGIFYCTIIGVFPSPLKAHIRQMEPRRIQAREQVEQSIREKKHRNLERRTSDASKIIMYLPEIANVPDTTALIPLEHIFKTMYSPHHQQEILLLKKLLLNTAYYAERKMDIHTHFVPKRISGLGFDIERDPQTGHVFIYLPVKIKEENRQRVIKVSIYDPNNPKTTVNYINRQEEPNKQEESTTNKPITSRKNTSNSNWNLADYFGSIRVLSMDQHGTRFKNCQKELEKIGLRPDQYTVVRSIDGQKLEKSLWNRMESWDIKTGTCPRDLIDSRKARQMGCFMSHYFVIKDIYRLYEQARKEYMEASKNGKLSNEIRQTLKKYSSLLVIEDNAGFGKVTGARSASLEGYTDLFKTAMQQLPKKWDMFYFMSMRHPANHSKRISSHIAKLQYGLITKCYAINASMYKKIILLLEEKIRGAQKIAPVDDVIATLHKDSHSYVATPPLSYRMASESQVFGSGKITPPEEWGHWQSDVISR